MIYTGTLIEYYNHCQRQAWLFYNKINLEDNDENVRIGKILHEINKIDDLLIEDIKVDKITKSYVVELKKSNADVNATKQQLLFYLYKLRQKGIHKKGLIKFLDTKEEIEILLTPETEKELISTMQRLKKLVIETTPPSQTLKINQCKRCAYYSYCYI